MLCYVTAALRLNQHFAVNDSFFLFQSACQKVHSTKTALARIHSDVLHHIDENNFVILVMLDLLAAFDTVDHSMLLYDLSTIMA